MNRHNVYLDSLKSTLPDLIDNLKENIIYAFWTYIIFFAGDHGRGGLVTRIKVAVVTHELTDFYNRIEFEI